MSLDLTDGKSTLVQQAITWANGDQDLCRHMVSLGPNELSGYCKYLEENGHRFEVIWGEWFI